MDPASLPATVLVLDDDAIRQLFTAILVLAGYDVLVATNGFAGLATLDRQRVDLIICDEVLPHLSGIEFCNRLARHPSHKAIPIILTRIYKVPSRKARHYRAFLAKPFDLDNLLDTVACVLAEGTA